MGIGVMTRLLGATALLLVAAACLRTRSATSLVFPAAQRTSCFGRPAHDATIYDTTELGSGAVAMRYEPKR